jgi:phosphoribosylformylglycinamidine (FGAM) synthase-like enzyme
MKAALSIAALAGAAAALVLAPAPAGAQGAQQEKVRRLVVYGKDPCPRAQSADEIVVCARRPETERYRIPRELRDSAAEDDAESTSWAARAEALEYVGRTGIQSCSTVGPGGVSGCWNEMVRAWRRDRRTGEGEPGR